MISCDIITAPLLFDFWADFGQRRKNISSHYTPRVPPSRSSGLCHGRDRNRDSICFTGIGIRKDHGSVHKTIHHLLSASGYVKHKQRPAPESGVTQKLLRSRRVSIKRTRLAVGNEDN